MADSAAARRGILARRDRAAGAAAAAPSALGRPAWLRDAWPPAALIAGLVVAWALVARVTGLDPFILPTPSDVLRAGWETRHLLGRAVATTMLEAVLGLSIAVVLGLALAAAMDLSGMLRRALYPVLVASQTVQILAIAPLLIIWFGFGLLPKVIIVVLVCFFPLAVSTADGLTSTNPDFVDLLRVAGARRRQVWRLARLPSAMPAFFSGLRIAVTYAVVAATIGEWVGGSEGLGLYMARSNNALATDQVFVAMLITTLLSVGMFTIVYALERLSLPWYYSREREAPWSGDATL